MRGFGLQRQRPVADQLRIAAVLLRKIGRWMPQYAVVADLLDGEVAAYVVFKVIRNAAEYFIVAFELGGLDGAAEHRGNRSRIPPDHVDEEMLQVIEYHLF